MISLSRAVSLALVVLWFAAGTAQAQSHWALVVGIDGYGSTAIAPAAHAVADAKGIAAALHRDLGYPTANIVTMTGDLPATDALYPTRANLTAQLQTLAGQIRADDSLFLYFADNAVKGDGGWALASVDTDPADGATAFSLAELQAALGNIAARQAFVAFDCASGAKGMDAGLATALKGLKAGSAEAPAASAVLLSCSAGQRGHEWTDPGHGAFAHFFDERAGR